MGTCIPVFKCGFVLQGLTGQGFKYDSPLMELLAGCNVVLCFCGQVFPIFFSNFK